MIKHCLLVAALLIPASAHAETLKFDHRLRPPLQATFDSSRDDLIKFENYGDRQFDQIVVQGNSLDNWTEALEITVQKRDRRLKSAADWFDQFRAHEQATCPSEWREAARDETSLTFIRRSRDCAGVPLQTRLYRMVIGSKSVFLIDAVYKGEMDETMRSQWLALLASAHID